MTPCLHKTPLRPPSASQNGPPQRFTPAKPCPVCGGYESMKRGQGTRCFGFTSADGEWCHCTREEFAGQAKRYPASNSYAHKLRGECPCGREHAPAPVGRFGSGSPEIETVYPYRDGDGTILFEVVRLRNPKTFRQRRPKGDGHVWDLKGVNRVLYRLPDLRAANVLDTVFIVEGEKDADRLWAEGLTATTNAGGAGKWRDEYSQELKGRHVAIIPDNDQPGRDHAVAVAQSVHPYAASVKVIELPGLPEKGDVSHWFNSGGTIEALGHIVDKAPRWSPAPPAPPAPAVGTAPPRRFPLTDLGNGEHFVAMHGTDVRYCHPWNKWLVWDGKRWALDQTAAIRRMAKAAVRAIYSEAAGQADDQERRHREVGQGQRVPPAHRGHDLRGREGAGRSRPARPHGPEPLAPERPERDDRLEDGPATAAPARRPHHLRGPRRIPPRRRLPALGFDP